MESHSHFFSVAPNHSSLPLQMALFCNVYALPVWLVIFLCAFYFHLLHIKEIYEHILFVISMFVALPLEIWRLYLGYSGNLRENVCVSNDFNFESTKYCSNFVYPFQIPDFAGFLIFSAFIQMPIHFVFAVIFYKIKTFSLIFIIQFVVFVLTVIEIIFGFRTMGRMTRYKAQQFHIRMINERLRKEQ